MDNKIDLNKEESFDFAPEEKKRRPAIKIAAFLAVFFLVVSVAFSFSAPTSDEELSWIEKIPIIGTLKQLVMSSDKKLKGEERGRINILLLGMGGKNHDGGLLTDTIILTSLDVKEKKAAMLSVPRDMSIPMEGSGWRKINNVNAFAEAESKGSGGLAASQAIGDILDAPIDYYLRLDFQGFINIIDKLGGIDVYAENTLEDQSYPIMGNEDDPVYNNRYEHLYIEKGWQKMDGKLALKYVRSRHAYGAEGSDFARSKRQQKVLEAVKDKFLSKWTLFKPKMITDIIGELNEHVSTNLKVWEIVKLWDIFKEVKNEDTINKGLDNSPNGLLTDTISEQGAYVLIPRSGDFSEIQYMVNNIFSNAPTESKKRVVTETASIEVLNGTWVNGLASQIALDLEKYGFEIVNVANYSQRDFSKSVIYDLTYGEKINSLTALKEKTGADANYGLPEWLIAELAKRNSKEENLKQPDFILIIGKDMDNSSSGSVNTEQ
jgi:LCP family protein required for cell wall assembly